MLRDKLFNKHQEDPGRPNTLSLKEEQRITSALYQVANWKLPLTSHTVV